MVEKVSVGLGQLEKRERIIQPRQYSHLNTIINPNGIPCLATAIAKDWVGGTNAEENGR